MNKEKKEMRNTECGMRNENIRVNPCASVVQPSSNPPSAIPIPKSLDYPEFREAWAAWVAHRERMLGHKISGKYAKKQMSKVVCWGREAAIAALRHSVRMGFREIWPESEGGIPHKEQLWMLREARARLMKFARSPELPETVKEDLEDFDL